VIDLPGPVAELCAVLGAQDRIQAATIGGSRAAGTSDETSDWDIGLYYRGHADFTMLARYGEVHSPGSWGPIMNGGAWLSLDGLKVDVMLRDLAGRRRRWVLNEKKLVECAGLESLHGWLQRIPATPADLVGWVGACRAALATA
jgi:hypothetical protein